MAKPYLVPAIKRAFQVIDLLAKTDSGLTISDIQRTLRLPLSSAAAILYTMQALGYLERNPDNARYILGVKMLSFSRRVLDQLNLVARCQSSLDELVRESGLTGHLAIRRDGESMYVARVAGSGLIQFSSYVGMRWPVYASAVGKALLAFLSEADRQKIIKELALRKMTARTITSAAALERQFQEFRRSGFCWEFSEGEANVACVAAPVFGPGHEVVAAVSITGTTHQITKTNLRSLGRVVKRHAQQMSTRLGDESK